MSSSAAPPLHLGGARVPPREVCVLFNGAADRDPAAFEDRDRLDAAAPRAFRDSLFLRGLDTLPVRF